MRLRALKAVFTKEVKLSFRKKAVLFWGMIFPLMLLTLLVVLFAPKGEQPALTKVVEVYLLPEEKSRELLNYTRVMAEYMSNLTTDGGKLFEATVYDGTLDAALEALRNGTIDAVVFIPKDAPRVFEESLAIKAKVYALTGTPNPTEERLSRLSLSIFFNSSSTYARLAVLSWGISELAERLRGQPIDPETQGLVTWLANVAESEGSQVEWVEVKPKEVEEGRAVRPYVVGWMTISVVFMEFMFMGIIGGLTSVASEFEWNYMTRIISTRVKPMELYLGKMASVLLTGFLTSVAVILWGTYVMGARFTHSLVSYQTLKVAVIMLVAALFTMSVGMLLGLAFRSIETANLAANALIWPTMMLGGFWIPKFMLPPEIRWFAEVNPMSNLMYAVVEVSSYGRSLSAYLTPLAATAVLTAALLAASSLLFSRKIAKLVEG